MGHIPRECGSILGNGAAIVTHSNRYAPKEQAKSRLKADPPLRVVAEQSSFALVLEPAALNESNVTRFL